jgi:hypothetical protein
MKILDKTKIDSLVNCFPGSSEYDKYGQIIVYTRVYLWKDGSYRDEPDPLVIKEYVDSRMWSD